MNTPPTDGIPVIDSTILDLDITFNWYNMKLSTEQAARDGPLGYFNPTTTEGVLKSGANGVNTPYELDAYVMWLNPTIVLESNQDAAKDSVASAVTWDGIYLPMVFNVKSNCATTNSTPTTALNWCGTAPSSTANIVKDTILVAWKPMSHTGTGATAVSTLEYDLCVKDSFVPNKIKGNAEAADSSTTKCNATTKTKNVGVRLAGATGLNYPAPTTIPAWSTVN